MPVGCFNMDVFETDVQKCDSELSDATGRQKSGVSRLCVLIG